MKIAHLEDMSLLELQELHEKLLSEDPNENFNILGDIADEIMARKSATHSLERMSTKELLAYQFNLEIDPVKYAIELDLIAQELIIRKLPFCKPLADHL